LFHLQILQKKFLFESIKTHHIEERVRQATTDRNNQQTELYLKKFYDEAEHLEEIVYQQKAQDEELQRKKNN